MVVMSFDFAFCFQGEPGRDGAPGLPGPSGEPVSDKWQMRKCWF